MRILLPLLTAACCVMALFVMDSLINGQQAILWQLLHL